MRGFVYDDSPFVLLRAGNGLGKTFSVAYKGARYAVDNPGTHGRISGPNRSQVRNVLSRYLYHFLKPYLAPGSVWRPGTGWTRNGTILLRNGSTIEVRSYQDDQEAHAGRWDLDWNILDEPPPRGIYDENKGRGRLWVTFTAVGRAPPLWLRKEIERDEPSPESGRTEHASGWVQYVVPCTRAAMPWKTDEEFEAHLAKYRGKHDEAQRLGAAWESDSDARRFGGFLGARHVLKRREMVRLLTGGTGEVSLSDVRVRMGLDWGVGKKLVMYLIFEQRGRYFVFKEWVGDNRTKPIDVAVAARDMMVSAGLGTFPACLRVLARPGNGFYGDVNNAGPAGAGDKLNIHLERAMLALAQQAGGWTELPFEVRAPSKRNGARAASEEAANHAMLEGRWYVSEECREAIRAYQQYEAKGDRDPFKDSIDAQMYAVRDLLLVDRDVAEPRRVVR